MFFYYLLCLIDLRKNIISNVRFVYVYNGKSKNKYSGSKNQNLESNQFKINNNKTN